MRLRRSLSVVGAGAMTLLLIGGPAAVPAVAAPPSPITPIQHLVVIFQENESFDHYFGTYPNAANTAGEDQFTALPGTPAVNNLADTPGAGGTGTLLTNNPNGANPARLDPGPNGSGVYNASLDAHGANPGIDNILTCSQNHAYQPEQNAFDGGAMDKFPGSVGSTANPPEPGEPACTANENLAYYDGNTVTGLWNYAQHFAMSDNSFSTGFGPSTPGALDVISGNTGGVTNVTPATNSSIVPDGQGGMSDINDADPFYDDCSSTASNFATTGQNVGDLLNHAGLSWGFFEGGFTASASASGATALPYNPATQTGKAVCATSHNTGAALGGTGTTGAQPYGVRADYIPHHQPFQYYANTANPRHLLPASLSAVGTDTQTFSGGSYGNGPTFDTANHQYDMSYFDQLVSAIGHGSMPASALPAVSYLKAPAYQDDHPGNSDPIDAQKFVTQEINALEQTSDWSNTAVVIAYDDSDGWYDHVFSGAAGLQNQSSSIGDTLTPPLCGGTPITGSVALGASTVVTAGVNDQVTYAVGGGATQALTIPAKTYTSAASVAAAIVTASSSVITAQANAAGNVVLTDNGLKSLAITGGDALPTLGLTAGSASTPASPTLTTAGGLPENGRCGFGPRQPLMVISPWAKANFVDHALSDQASVPNFIEYNWQLPGIAGSADRLLTNATSSFDLHNMFDFSGTGGTNPILFLDPTTFQPTTMPTPVVPDSRTPALFVLSGVLLFGGAVVVLGRQQLRRRSQPA